MPSGSVGSCRTVIGIITSGSIVTVFAFVTTISSPAPAGTYYAACSREFVEVRISRAVIFFYK